MIVITADTVYELAYLQKLIETGVLNSDKKATINVTYRLSSDDILLIDKYNSIVGSKSRDEDKAVYINRD